MNKRRTGIPNVESAKWGEHMCVFFRTKSELLDLVVPYIKAGLEDNEFCMWITGGPVNERDAFEALENVLPNAHEYLAKRQLEILPHSQWYLSSGVFNAQIVLENWVSKARHSEQKGFAGIRITGDPFWLHSEADWKAFGCYEHAVQKAISTERVIALCTYPMAICQSKHVVDTIAAHSSALHPVDDQWQRLQVSREERPLSTV